MSNLFILLSMIFMHIVADYTLQGDYMAASKQKSWWEQNYPDKKYKYDYIMILLVHSFEWAFSIMFPLFVNDRYIISYNLVYLLILNMLLHSIIDDGKANRKIYNLFQDQLLHFSQILITWIICSF